MTTHSFPRVELLHCGRPKRSRVRRSLRSRQCEVWGRSGFLAAARTCRSPVSQDKGLYTSVRRDTVGGNCDLVGSDFELAKALVRGLPLPQSRIISSPLVPKPDSKGCAIGVATGESACAA